jgi:hypothetical protein
MFTEVFIRVCKRDFAYPEAIEIAIYFSKTKKVVLVARDGNHADEIYNRVKSQVDTATEKEFGKKEYDLTVLDWDYPLGRYLENIDVIIVANPDPVRIQHLKYRLRNMNVILYIVRPF